MKRVPRQAVLGFSRRERVLNRQIAQRAAGEKVTPGPGRPAKKRNKLEGHDVRVGHETRVALSVASAVHVTLPCSGKVPSLRTRRRFRCIKKAFSRANQDQAFRVVFFEVLGNHIHLIVEVDSKEALSKGVQKITLSISRSLNAESVSQHGGSLDPRLGSWGARPGWIGKVFRDRYHSHVLASPTEVKLSVQYVFDNARKHYGRVAPSIVSAAVDAFCSVATERSGSSVVKPQSWALRRAIAPLNNLVAPRTR